MTRHLDPRDIRIEFDTIYARPPGTPWHVRDAGCIPYAGRKAVNVPNPIRVYFDNVDTDLTPYVHDGCIGIGGMWFRQVLFHVDSMTVDSYGKHSIDMSYGAAFVECVNMQELHNQWIANGPHEHKAQDMKEFPTAEEFAKQQHADRMKSLLDSMRKSRRNSLTTCIQGADREIVLSELKAKGYKIEPGSGTIVTIRW